MLTIKTKSDFLQTEELEYVGFWKRVAASIIDTILLLLVT